VHIGFITAKNSSRYSESIAEVEETGRQVFVQEQVRRQGNEISTTWVALIDCCYPDEL
jgi:hypothetical protein